MQGSRRTPLAREDGMGSQRLPPLTREGGVRVASEVREESRLSVAWSSADEVSLQTQAVKLNPCSVDSLVLPSRLPSSSAALVPESRREDWQTARRSTLLLLMLQWSAD